MMATAADRIQRHRHRGPPVALEDRAQTVNV